MKKMHVVIMALFVAVLLVSGCTGGGGNTNVPTVSPNTGSQDTLSKEVANDITNVENTNTDLNDADVDNLDKDLANVNW